MSDIKGEICPLMPVNGFSEGEKKGWSMGGVHTVSELNVSVSGSVGYRRFLAFATPGFLDLLRYLGIGL